METATALALRSCLSRFVTGVAVVTFDGPRGRSGITCNSFTSVSLDPPLVLVSVARTARSHDDLHDRSFCVNVLGAEQEATARSFAGRPAGEPAWLDHPVAPRLAGPLAWLACEPWREYDGGDHTLFLGLVSDFGYRDGDALGYANSRFTVFAEPAYGHEFLL
jgi:flavin reductase (DIM6/NTAB) family NADH-FMN oxidoreductase RutF